MVSDRRRVYVGARLQRHSAAQIMKTAFTRFRRTLIVVLAAGCAADELVSPSPGPVSLAADFVSVPGGTVTLGTPNPNSPAATVALPNFNKRVLLRATVTGSVDISLTPL